MSIARKRAPQAPEKVIWNQLSALRLPALIVANKKLDQEASMVDETGSSTIIGDAAMMLKDPTGFYRGMEKTGGLIGPLLYVVVMAAFAGLIVALLSLLGAGVTAGIALDLRTLVVFPIVAVIGSFAAALILFLIWKLLGSVESLETAYRCVAYATVVYPVSALLGLIPYLGSIVGVAWGMYLMTIATTEVHRLKRKTAYIVFGVLGVLLIASNISAERESRRMAPRQETAVDRAS